MTTAPLDADTSTAGVAGVQRSNDRAARRGPRQRRQRRVRSLDPRPSTLDPLMRYIEPHAHMVSRTTDDYLAMVTAGCAAVCEPAFWAGFDRSSAHGFYDYFCQLTDYEPKRAAKFGLPHFSWLCINPKEAEYLTLADEVLSLIPQFLDRPNVLGIGEIGLNKNTRNELAVLEKHIDLAARHDQLILVHTPHLEDKLKGTRLIVDLLKSDTRIRPERVIIDHVEEHTVRLALDAG